MAGRPRKPYKMRVLEGGRGKSRPLTPDLEAPKDPLVPPKGLSLAEKKAWKQHVAWLRKLKLESAVDAGQVEAMVRMLCRARRADGVVARRGVTMETAFNGTIVRPEVGISERCWRHYEALANRFGLDPQARTKLGGGDITPESAGDVPADLRDASGG